MRAKGEKPTVAENAIMKTGMKLYKSKHDSKDAPKVKTLAMQLSITNHDLGVEVRRAFNLAKSSGQELNLSFSRGTR
jgi:hypothetical protein